MVQYFSSNSVLVNKAQNFLRNPIFFGNSDTYDLNFSKTIFKKYFPEIC